MTEKINFIKNEWEDKFEHAYTYRFECKPKVVQLEDCVANSRNSEMADGFDYVTLMSKKKYPCGTKISAECSFENYGAPLFTFTDVLERDDKGDLRYGKCYEVVLWEKGINVWEHYMENGTVKWYKLMSVNFSVDTNKKYELITEYKEKMLIISVDGHDMSLRIENMPNEMYLGFTLCEDINRLYTIKIEENIG